MGWYITETKNQYDARWKTIRHISFKEKDKPTMHITQLLLYVVEEL